MGIGCAMAAERWVWTNEKPYISYVEISALRTDTGNSHANKFHFGKDRGYCPCRKGAYHGCVALKPLQWLTLWLTDLKNSKTELPDLSVSNYVQMDEKTTKNAI